MALSEPTWRVKTRPCPFYQRGTCLFADSCNFLHTVSVKPPTYSSFSLDSPQTLLPTVTIDSPRSVRSPPRSPRLSGLLSALGDVLSDESDEDVDTEESLPEESLTWPEDPSTLVDKMKAGRLPRFLQDLSTERVSSGEDPLSDDDDIDEFSDDLTAHFESFMNRSQALPFLHDSGRDSGNHSGSVLTDLNAAAEAGAFSQMSLLDNNDNSSTDLHKPSSHHARSISGTSGLLSPVQVSDLHLLHFARIDHPNYKQDSIDSTLDSWKPPSPHVGTPPRSPALSSTFDLLSSPFGNISSRVLSPRLNAILGRSPTSMFAQPLSGQAEDEPADLSIDSPSAFVTAQSPHELKDLPFAEELAPSYQNEVVLGNDDDDNASESDEVQESDYYCGSTSVWEIEGGPTAVFLGAQSGASLIADDVKNAIRVSREISTQFLQENNVNFVDAECNTSQFDDAVEQESLASPHDETPTFIAVEESKDDYEHPTERDIVPGGSEAMSNPLKVSLEEEAIASQHDGHPSSPSTKNNASRVNSPLCQEAGTFESDGATFGSTDIDETLDNTNTFSLGDSTAELAYLSSPTVPRNEDTLNSLYDVYSFMSPEEAEEIELPHTVASTSAPTSPPSPALQRPSNSAAEGPLRERVFTPPPPRRGRSGTLTADSPTTLSSPVTSLDSSSRGRASPFSSTHSAKRSGSSETNHSNEVEPSKKIPFGFRQSVGRGRSNTVSHLFLPPLSIGPRSPLEHDPPIPESIPPPSPVKNGLKPLRLSTVINAPSYARSIFSSRLSNKSSANNFRPSGSLSRSSISASVSSSMSKSRNPLLSSARSSFVPAHIRNTLSSSPIPPSPLSSVSLQHLPTFDAPRSAPAYRQSWRAGPGHIRDISSVSAPYNEPTSKFSESSVDSDDDDNDDDDTYDHDNLCNTFEETIRRPVGMVPHSAPVRDHSSLGLSYAAATPRPTLMFAIASDDVEQVRRVLEGGDAGPNDTVGPQSALAFTLTNDQLQNKMEIVKTLLAFGADPAVLKTEPLNPQNATGETAVKFDETQPTKSLMDRMDPATRYYVEKADAQDTRRTSALIHRSFFRPLTRVRYELVGQDRALEQLFRVLNMHSRKLAVTPIVVLLCGPSGHGKSLLARKFGSLLDVPTHTVNMTTLRSTHDLWQSYSMSPYETPTSFTLAEFLINNEGKRCVVVLDEIEKTSDEKTLVSLLMPWELGRCSFEAGSRHIDVRNVIWLGTSNVGHDLVFQHQDAREQKDESMSREEYHDLMGLLRPQVSNRLGASVLSRVTTVLPFVPFTAEEKKAICSEALFNLGGDVARLLSTKVVNSIITSALASYIPAEGARSLYRAISNQMVDII